VTLSIRNIIPIIKAKFVGINDIAIIDAVSIDSRSLQNSENTLFFAIIGPNNDGHHYVNQLIENGVVNFVVSYIPSNLQGKANFWWLKTHFKHYKLLHQLIEVILIFQLSESQEAMENHYQRMVEFLLSPDYNIIRSPKSYNSQVGVPLSVLGINEKHNLGIFEAGISTTNEMANLQKSFNQPSEFYPILVRLTMKDLMMLVKNKRKIKTFQFC